MNFQNIPPVESGKSMLDLAFKKARERGKQKKLIGNWLQIIRKKECLKLDIIKDTLTTRLFKILTSFPGTSELPQFYQKLIKLTLDFTLLKKSFGAVDWAIKKIRFFHREYVSKVTKTKDRGQIKDLTRQFYGRISSILKQINPQLAYLEQSRKIMRTYPDIKEMFTICIYGFPNVGKTTLLNKLTKTKAKTAAYAFTTKTINAGYLTINGKKIQILDVPGTLARKEKMNNIELQADLVMQEVADLIIYAFDLSGYSGYSIKKQKQLLINLGKKKKVLIYVCKKDLPESEEALKDFSKKHYTINDLKEEIFKIA